LAKKLNPGEERVYTINLSRAWESPPRWQRAKYAILLIRRFISRHMKVPEDRVWIDNALNELIWSRGAQKPPRKVVVRAIYMEDEEGPLVEVLPSEGS